MWHTLRAELAYLRSWLLGGLGIALGVVALVTAIFSIFGGPPAFIATAIRAMFPLTATLIVAFIAQAYRTEERRARLLLAGPLTPQQLAVVSVLIPLTVVVCGTVVAGLIVAVESAITGALVGQTLQIVGYVGGQFLLYTLIGLLIHEIVVSGRERRRGAAVAGWATLFGGALLLTVITLGARAFQRPWNWPILHAADLVAAACAMVVIVLLYRRRSDFTR
jgi:hypothetical protein